MRTLGNIIWHIPFLGFLFALGYALGGLFFCITIIGIPIGLGWLQFSLFLLSPFNKAMVSRKDLELLTGQQQGGAMQTFSTIVRILYFPFGLLAAIGALCTIVCEFISLIGIPSGIVWAKLLSTIFNPVNKVCVPRAVAIEIERRKSEGTLDKYTSQQTTYPTSSENTTTCNGSIKNEYIEKAQQKSDDELEEIIRLKDDYNPRLVKAAEMVLQARVTGIEIRNEEPEVIPYTYQNNLDFTNLKGGVLVMAGVLLPLLISPIISLLQNLYISIFKHENSEYRIYLVSIIYIFLGIAGVFLIFKGLLKIKKEYEEKINTGVLLILIGSFMDLIISVFTLRVHYLMFTGGSMPNIIHDITFFYLPLFSSILTLIGIVLWKYLNKDKNLSMTGLLLICFGIICSLAYHPFLSTYIHQNFLNSTCICIYYLKSVIILAISIFGWYKFIGLDKKTY